MPELTPPETSPVISLEAPQPVAVVPPKPEESAPAEVNPEAT